ncbi:extracellular solute-binding protein [Streptomyces armeniacus]|uniref:Extracellular solute-binding protein n=1 Tax=Streptomyces armeniacus TaxID=83291 RepID=A0A345XJW4_9ACTN|nr:extracellular solute-binding protein [Streptomyces armeniacus]AXK31930.1 extracellular solute-binding protein [Streptomyces armeniacus]
MLTRTSPRLYARSAASARRALAFAMAAVLLVGGCGALSDSGGDGTTTVDVWLMKGSLTDEFTKDFVNDYESRNPGVEASVTVHEWPGINKKVHKALRSGDGPDVIEVGNTQVAEYVEAGGVRNFTTEVVDLGGDDWIDGLAASGQVDGYQFGVPFYAANRVVIYRKDLFRQAGIESPPRTREQWLSATELLDGPPGQQGIYLPGQNWYVLAGFIWDEGGDLAVERSGRWAGEVDSPEALRGMDFYSRLQSYGEARPDADEADPDELQVFAKGEIAQLIAVPGSAKLITDTNPELAGKLGFFPVPGKKAGTPGAVFTGGSVLIMPEKSDAQEEGYEFIKQLASDDWQQRMARTMSFVPNKSTLTGALESEPGAAAMAKAAENGRATPASPHWGDLEARNPLKEYQTAVLRGADARKAARTASEKITRLLSGGP